MFSSECKLFDVSQGYSYRANCQLPACCECYINNHLHSQCQVPIVWHFQENWQRRSSLSVTQRGSAKNCPEKLLTLKHTHVHVHSLNKKYPLGWLAMNVSHRGLTGCGTSLTTDSSSSSSRSICSHYQDTYFLQPVLSTLGAAPAGTSLQHLPEEVSIRHLNRCLSPLSCLCSAWRSSDSISSSSWVTELLTLSKGASSQPVEPVLVLMHFSLWEFKGQHGPRCKININIYMALSCHVKEDSTLGNQKRDLKMTIYNKCEKLMSLPPFNKLFPPILYEPTTHSIIKQWHWGEENRCSEHLGGVLAHVYPNRSEKVLGPLPLPALSNNLSATSLNQNPSDSKCSPWIMSQKPIVDGVPVPSRLGL